MGCGCKGTPTVPPKAEKGKTPSSTIVRPAPQQGDSK